MSDIVKAGSMLPQQYDYGKDSGAGLETSSSSELMIPFLVLLQDLSPQVIGSNDKAIPGARAGKFLHSLTEEVLGESILFVPAYKEASYVEWVPRSEGGGFRGRYLESDPVIVRAKAQSQKFGKLTTEEGNQLQETFYLYGVIADDPEALRPVVIAFSSTKLKPFRRWISAIREHFFKPPVPPIYSHLVRVGSVREKNAYGTYFNITLAPASGSLDSSLLSPDAQRYIAARRLHETVKAGMARTTGEAPESPPWNQA